MGREKEERLWHKSRVFLRRVHVTARWHPLSEYMAREALSSWGRWGLHKDCGSGKAELNSTTLEISQLISVLRVEFLNDLPVVISINGPTRTEILIM